MRSGTGSGRGRHRNASSPETRRWKEIAPKVNDWPEPKPKPKRNQHGVRILGKQALEAKLDSVLHLEDTEPGPEAPTTPKRSKPLGPAPAQPPPDRPAWLADDEVWLQLLEMRKTQ